MTSNPEQASSSPEAAGLELTLAVRVDQVCDRFELEWQEGRASATTGPQVRVRVGIQE
jgi:hypothetical protein